jgi:hypothetical protein
MAKTVEAAASSTDVEIANGTLTVSEPVKLEGLVIGATAAASGDTEGVEGYKTAEEVVKGHIKDLKVEIGGSTYTAKVVDCKKAQYIAVVDNKDTAKNMAAASSSVCYMVDEEMYVSRTSDVKVLVNLTADNFQRTINFTSIQ